MPDVQVLMERLRGEFDAARQRVMTLRTEAAEAYQKKRLRYDQFLAASQDIGRWLESHIDAFTHFFSNVDEHIDILHLGARGHEVHGAFVTFHFPHNKECPAEVTLKFTLGHDADIHNIEIAYDLTIVPIYLQFEKHDVLRLPLDQVNQEAVTTWFDDKLTKFTATYLNMRFVPQYQEESMVPDRVMGITFPRPFAAGTVTHEGATYYFYTEESMRDFQANPEVYVAAAKK